MGNTDSTNQTIKIALDPTKNGFTEKLDPNKTGFINALDPTKNGFADKLLNDKGIKNVIKIGNDAVNNDSIKSIYNNVKNVDALINQIKIDLSKPQKFNPKETTKQVLQDPTIKEITKPVQPYIDQQQHNINSVVDNLPETTKPQDLINSGLKIGDQVVTAINNFINPKIEQPDYTMTYLIIGAIIIGGVIILKKKKINK